MVANLHDILSLLFVVTISAICFVRFLSLRYKLLCEVKKYMPEKYNQLFLSHKNLLAFIRTDEDTGNNKIDVLRIKARESIKIAILFLIASLMFFIAIAICQFI